MDIAQAARDSWVYVEGIRNSSKHLFAMKYREHLLYGTEEPHRPIDLGIMAVQAVRMRLDEMFSMI